VTDLALAAPHPAPTAPYQLVTPTDGGWLAAVTPEGVHVLERGVPRRLLAAPGAWAAAAADQLWVAARAGGTWSLHTFAGTGAAGGSIELGPIGPALALTASRTARIALAAGERSVLITQREGALVVDDLGSGEHVLLGPGLVALRRGATLACRRGRTPPLTLPADLATAAIVGAVAVLEGAAVCLEVVTAGHHTLLLFDLRSGGLRTRVRLGTAQVGAVAEQAGRVVLVDGARVALLDLRRGACVAERCADAAITAVAIDARGERVTLADEHGAVRGYGAHLDADDAVAEAPRHLTVVPAAPAAPAPAPAPPSPTPPAPAPRPAAPGRDGELRALADVPLVGFGLHRAAPALPRDAHARYLDDLRAWVAALCRPAGGDPAADAEATAAFARWRDGAPHVELADRLGLSPLAGTLLVLAAAPQIWGELARSYGQVSADPARPLVDELLLAQLLGADAVARVELARELDDDAPLIRSGAIERGRGTRPYAALTVHPVIARALAGDVHARGGHRRRRADRRLDELLAPRAQLIAAIDQLRRASATPARLVVRGRPGSGRRTVAATLAAQAGRDLGLVDIVDDSGLRQRLHDVALAGDLPCVGLDDLGDDAALRARVRAILDDHPGPLAIRAPRLAELPLTPGHCAIELAPLDETERHRAWQAQLAGHALSADAGDLAARFTVGPGAIAAACARTAEHRPDGDATGALAAVVRQHRSARIAAIAARVERLAGWDELIVGDDIADSLREVVARIRHRRTVLDDWGMDRAAATAQGVTVLLQGGPGTGKTMAAGVLARALGYELWRVDLSKVVSKWIGETEKNLGAAFDAAEDGEIVLLFDEADSLFGKRTEVRSSQDRNANAETNYLLQRLDSFAGVAILTTNLGAAIDPAFRRRLSVHVQFPFPDEDERERLWRAHLPASLPVAGELDLAALAHTYQLSGGYIRNAALRAAYLAAGEGQALGAAHLHRAVALEYQRAGKLGGGRLE
jgi:predicted kinase